MLVFAAKAPEGEIIVLCLELLGALCVLALLVVLVRRWTVSKPNTKDDDEWSLQHLRDMKATGQITESEFEALKVKMIAASRKNCE